MVGTLAGGVLVGHGHRQAADAFDEATHRDCMFGTSGIRGAVGETVTAALALAVGRAVGVDAERVVVGRDPRESGRLLVDALTAGLREQGTAVVDLGMAASPTVARAVGWEDAQAGVSVTASHNPPPDNGMKLWQASGQAFTPAQQRQIADRVTEDSWQLRSAGSLGTRRRTDGQRRHLDRLVESVDSDIGLPVVVDVGNGAGGITVEALRELGCAVRTLNGTPDGRFPGRPSEPTAANCGALRRLVASSDALLGVAHDGDADRMMAVTEDGEFLSGDVLLAILAEAAVTPGDTVAVPVDTSLAVEDFLDEKGVTVERTPVGDVHIAHAVAAGARFGGEPSGAWIWQDETYCPDGPLAALKLAVLATERPLAERAAAIPTYPIRRSTVETTAKTELMGALERAVTEEYETVSGADGVRVSTADGWFLVRASGTESLVRVTAEAREAERSDRLAATALDLVENTRTAVE